MEFQSTQKLEGSVLHLSFSGTIDEDTNFPEVDLSGVASVQLDLNGIKSINSVGIREWLDWIRPVAEKAPIVLENCPKSMVFQFNMVDGFLPPQSSVKSFFVPFFCESCDKEQNLLFNVGHEVAVDGGNLKISFDAKQASGCGEASCSLEMDVTEAKYFQFLKRG
jgi:thiol-disulfide isomerase/thioredoxin